MERPIPTALPETEPFWQGCRDGVLLLQRCRACGSLQYYPRAVCTACLSSDLGWRRGQDHNLPFRCDRPATTPRAASSRRVA